MKESFCFKDLDQKECTVEFELIQTPSSWRTYGIRGRMRREQTVIEQAEAAGRFLTRQEAEETIKVLCANQVTPCTLNAVLE